MIEACNSHVFSHQPGIAVGGHCIPIYPRMYLWDDPQVTIVRAARVANRSMPRVRGLRSTRSTARSRPSA